MQPYKDRLIAAIWDCIGTCRYGSPTQANFHKVELELRRIVSDLQSHNRDVQLHRLYNPITAPVPPGDMAGPWPEIPSDKACSLENPEHCEACE